MHKLKRPIFQLSIIFLMVMLVLNANPTQGYTNTSGVQTGDIIDIEYEGKTQDDGQVFDAGRINPADISPGQFIDGFYSGILGMKVGETKVITIPPEDGYSNDPSHALFGRTLIFTVHVYSIITDINGNDDSSSGGVFSTMVTVGSWIVGIGVAGFILFSLNSLRVSKTTGTCAHCKSLNRSTLSEGTCGKCGNAYCRKSFVKGCPNCNANSFIPYK